jgi:NADH-quinone oxidoreductase subunit E
MLAEKYPEQVRKIFAKYPPEQKQSAVMPLLHLAQREKGFVDRHDMREIADLCGITETDVAEIVGFYTLYHDKPQGKLRIQVCTDIACALRGADEFLAQLCERLGIRPGETTPDGLVTVEAVTCLAACDKAPVFQVQGPHGISYHENMTVDKTLEFIEAARKEGKS